MRLTTRKVVAAIIFIYGVGFLTNALLMWYQNTHRLLGFPPQHLINGWQHALWEQVGWSIVAIVAAAMIAWAPPHKRHVPALSHVGDEWLDPFDEMWE
jgi:hypothetical protein